MIVHESGHSNNLRDNSDVASYCFKYIEWLDQQMIYGCFKDVVR